MIIDHMEIENILTRLAKKIGVSLEEEVTLEEVIKKVQNQNLCYQNESIDIDLLRPSFKEAFFVRNAEFVVDGKQSNEINVDEIIYLKMLNSKSVMVHTFDEKKRLNYDGKNIRVKFTKEIPLDLCLKMFF